MHRVFANLMKYSSANELMTDDSNISLPFAIVQITIIIVDNNEWAIQLHGRLNRVAAIDKCQTLNIPNSSLKMAISNSLFLWKHFEFAFLKRDSECVINGRFSKLPPNNMATRLFMIAICLCVRRFYQSVMKFIFRL